MDERVFTDHVKGLLAGTPANDGQIIDHLRQVIEQKLRRLGYWQLPPSYLRLDGESWTDTTALDDLAQEVYIACIFNGLTRFAEYLAGSDTIEGAVHQKITWYLQQRKRDGNPLATRVYKNIRAASETLVVTGAAKTNSAGELRGDTIILRLDRESPNSENELEEIFANDLQDSDFVKAIVKECLPSLRVTQNRIESRLHDDLSGYVINHLAALFSNESKLGHEVSLDADDSEGSENCFDFLAESGTPSPDDRYLQAEGYEGLLKSLRDTASSSISNPRIQERVLKALDLIADLIVEGEDTRELSIRRLADRLAIPKTTLARDFARLRPANQEGAAGEET